MTTFAIYHKVSNKIVAIVKTLEEAEAYVEGLPVLTYKVIY